MKWLLIGHRAVGKTSLLWRLQKYFKENKNLMCFDLDQEIVNQEDMTITELIQRKGEDYFRQIEIKKYKELSGKFGDFIISLGAGFDLSALDPSHNCLWVRRASDLTAKILLDRPRLDPQKNIESEYLERAKQRDVSYFLKSTWIYDMPEGIQDVNEIEKNILRQEFRIIDAILTANPKILEKLVNVNPVQVIEIRDDLLSSQQAEGLAASLPKNRFLFSFRNPQFNADFIPFLRSSKSMRCDYPLEFEGNQGYPKVAKENSNIISVHHIARDIPTTVKKLEEIGGDKFLKLALPTNSFQHLFELYKWQQQSPKRRSYLPMSNSAKWTWFRLFMKGKQPINFLRWGTASATDQPTLFEWLNHPKEAKYFAAVLGRNVDLSWSPLEHNSFFKEKNIPFYRINIEDDEFPKALPLLAEMGLRWAAVTAPFKEKAFQFCTRTSNVASQLKAVNTLYFDDSKKLLFGDNTDIMGFRRAIEDIDIKDEVVLWGGGGTRNVIKSVIPHVVEYSARTGEPRVAIKDPLNPRILIWAGSNKSIFPPSGWHPEIVVDLNYSEDSLAKIYAYNVKAKYRSGVNMFKAQALEQRIFWSQFL